MKKIIETIIKMSMKEKTKLNNEWILFREENKKRKKGSDPSKHSN